MELLASPGQSCPGEGWFADVSSFVNAIISIDCKTKTVRICVLCESRTLVIFSMFLTDLSHGSISRRVAVFQAF